MATIISRRELAAIAIPADCLEDLRSALIREIEDGGDRLRVLHDEVLSSDTDIRRADRDGELSSLRSDLRLLDDLFEARGDTKATADPDTLADGLQAMVRVLADRLGTECELAPIDMGAVLELAGRLRWAAEEAIRIYPELDEAAVA